MQKMYWELEDILYVEIHTAKIKYMSMVCFVTRMQGKILMRRELTGLSDIWHG